MDHFCPWMNNTVGFNNYQYFVLFLLYLTLGCAYVLSCLYFASILHDSGGEVVVDRDASIGLMDYTVSDMLTVVLVICISGFIGCLFLFIFHSYLILTNQTTLEFYINWDLRQEAKKMNIIYKNPFDQGYKKNIRRILTDIPWYQLLYPHFVSRHPKPLYPIDLCETNFLESSDDTSDDDFVLNHDNDNLNSLEKV